MAFLRLKNDSDCLLDSMTMDIDKLKKINFQSIRLLDLD